MAHTFSVWAPVASDVALVLDGDRRLPMVPWPLDQRQGWWQLHVPDAGPGTRYRFSVDGRAPLPDPRSARQPDGVHSASEVVDLESYTWHDQHWRGVNLRSAVIYEAHVGTFSPEGTFDGVARRLDHLAGLGVDLLELMPVAAFPGRWGWGYDGVDLFAVHEPYGGPRELQALVDAAHARGIGVLLDVVYNHLGPDGNNLGQFGPYFTDRHATPWGAALNLDGPGSDEVRSFVVDNALWWLEGFHLDGLRLDAVHALVDPSPTPILEELSGAVAELSSRSAWRRWLVAESDADDPRLVLSAAAGGQGMDAVWGDDFHHALWVAVTGERDGYYADFDGVGDLARVLEHGWAYAGRYAANRGRRHGRGDRRLAGWQVVVCDQNHDQVGNRARGERMAALADEDRLRLSLGLLLTSPFVPMIFQGEEWGATTPFAYFSDHGDEELARAVTEGRRREFAAFGWSPEEVLDPQAPETFRASCLDWSQAQSALSDWTRSLVALRRRCSWLGAGRFERVCVEHDAPAGWLVVRRGPGAIAANLGASRVTFPAPEGELLASSGGATLCRGNVELPAGGFAVVGPRAPVDAGTPRWQALPPSW